MDRCLPTGFSFRGGSAAACLGIVCAVVGSAGAFAAGDGGDAAASAHSRGHSIERVRRDGAFGFPQREAVVLAEQETFRFSVFTDARHLYAQAVFWTDDSDALGQTDDGRPIGDQSSIVIDVDGNGSVTAQVDRTCSLNPWPSMPGLRHQIHLGGGASTGLRTDSTSRGAIRLLEVDGGRRIRVDSFLIPLADIGRQTGDVIRIAFWGSSTVPPMVVNSVGHTSTGRIWAHHLPIDRYHELTLSAGDTMVIPEAVPDGRQDETPEAARPAPLGRVPEVGTVPPELVAEAWINVDGPLTLADLRGHVVVIEFWATWCAPCVAGIPHLNALHDAHHASGLRILSFTDQSREHVEAFMQKTPMRYGLGVGSRLSRTYGVTGIPHAFIVGRDGLLRWHGHPGSDAFRDQLAAALE